MHNYFPRVVAVLLALSLAAGSANAVMLPAHSIGANDSHKPVVTTFFFAEQAVSAPAA
jgi:hypothetical protein